ncbi:MAG TPA: sigma-70 family RNA polymerase sigma factor [Solirubrobacteraceae bacterium]|jgi:DNA-directed RNA polymerase specialized sigma24 family protein|nr:sigma-70 family RNA polymerase sigma factor [Solirubrobacteraceae bacterium]
MSPLSLRRHRAERMLRERFEELRGRVLASVRGRLRASGASVDEADLDACYSQAWQGLYMAIVDGEEIANPAGWLVLVTYRRAIDEHRARIRTHGGERVPGAANGSGGVSGGTLVGESTGVDAIAAAERDLAAELDDRTRLRQLFEGLRGRLDAREREAATLCYLQGLSRADAAARMGVSEARMRKLMEGRGAGRPGVAAKMGQLVASIREDGWCKEQGSLMRALAYGVLDPDGERYQLALMHSSQCPSCRAYVVSLRGLAAALPPVLLPGSLAAAVLAHVGQAGHAIAAGAGAAGSSAAGSAGSGTAAGGAGGSIGGGGAGAAAQAGRGLGGGLSASGAGAAGAGGAAAGGGWLFAGGPLSAKLAVGCLLALGVGAGCLALEGQLRLPGRSPAHDTVALPARVNVARPVGLLGQPTAEIVGASGRPAAVERSGAALTPAARATREFGPEQAPSAASGSAATPAAGDRRSARAASVRRMATANAGHSTPSATAADSAVRAGEDSGAAAEAQPSAGQDSAAAEREFSPG